MKKNEKDTKLYFMPILMTIGFIVGLIIGYNVKNVSVCMIISVVIGSVIGFIIDNTRK